MELYLHASYMLLWCGAKATFKLNWFIIVSIERSTFYLCQKKNRILGTKLRKYTNQTFLHKTVEIQETTRLEIEP
jgi:hypothetical protein